MQTEIVLAVVCAVAVGRFRIAQLGRLPRNRSGGPIFRTKCFRINRYLGDPSFHTTKPLSLFGNDLLASP